jgi:hypothetical protein
MFSGRDGFLALPDKFLKLGNSGTNGFDILLVKTKSGQKLEDLIPQTGSLTPAQITAIADDIDDIHIGECKQVYVKLNSISGGIPQMSQAWCRNVIERMRFTDNNTDAIKNLGEVLSEVIEERRKTYTRSVMGVHKTQKLICIARIN